MRLDSGIQLGHYKILSTLGKGGMGEVYRAVDLNLGRDVAIKVLPEAVADNEELLSRFEKEAKALAALAHPNILTIFEFGNHNGITYAVTEILDGESLRSRISRSRVQWKQVVEISAAIAEGMAAAHSKGIIHRDLKPENIFLLSDGRVKILDFGLVHWHPKSISEEISFASTQMRQTESTPLFGTVPYMSPEQLSGSIADPRSDIFSFGCILYEILSGKHPFLGKTLTETTASILKDEPSKFFTQDTDVPPSLERIVFRCLDKNPNKRYQSSKDLAFDLTELRNDFLTPTRIPSQSVSVPKKTIPFPKVLFAFLILCLLAAGIWWLKNRSAPPMKIEKSIAVLPFSNLSNDKEDEYFSDGMTEDIITNLSKISNLKVVSRTSSMRYKNTNKSLREIGNELKVTSLLQGSVRREGNRLRISAQLIDANTDNHIWADTYDRQIKDVFAIQSDVAKKIAAALQVNLLPEERKKVEWIPTQNITAYDYYLKGVQYYRQYRGEPNETAIQLFQKATEVDPNFALGYVGLCDAYSMRPSYGGDKKSLDLAIEACKKALSIDPNLALAYATIYKPYTFKGLFQEGEKALHKAYELDPNDPIVIGRLASDYQVKGKLEESFRFAKRYIEMEPTNAFAYFTMGFTYYALADFIQAENFFKQSLELQPDFAFAKYGLAMVHMSQGKSNEVRELINQYDDVKTADATFGQIQIVMYSMVEDYSKLIEYSRRFPFSTNYRFAHALLKVGKLEEGHKAIEEAYRTFHSEDHKGAAEWEYELACIQAIRGKKDEALKQLRKAYDLGFYSYSWIERDPIFEEMRGNPEFQEILQKMKSEVAEIRRRLGI